MTNKETWDAAWKELTLTTDSYPQWKRKGFPGGTHWSKAKALGDQIGVAPPTPPDPPPVDPPPTPTVDTLTVAEFNRLTIAGSTIRNAKIVNADGTVASISWTAKNVTLVNVEFDYCVLQPGADGARFLGVKGRSFNLNGINNWEIGDNSVFDGQSRTTDAIIRGWNGVIGGPWTIHDSFFRNYSVPGMSPSTEHCQAIFVGSSHGGIIENCHFDSNGNSGHLFISSWGYNASAVPDVKIRGNSFGQTWAYYSVNVHPDEIPATAPVCVSSSQPSIVTLCSRGVFVKGTCP